MGSALTFPSPTCPRSHPPGAALPDTGTPAPLKIQQNPAEADLCNDCLEELPPPTHEQKHRVPRLPGKSSAPHRVRPCRPGQSSPCVPSLDLKVLKSPRASFSLRLKDISSMSSVYLTSFSLTASSPQRCDLFHRAPGPSLPAAPQLSPGDGVSVTSRSPARIPAQHRADTGTTTLGEENLKAASQHKPAVPPLSRTTYRWMHQTLSEELKYEHKFSF